VREFPHAEREEYKGITVILPAGILRREAMLVDERIMW
jgi:hypothetical protein